MDKKGIALEEAGYWAAGFALLFTLMLAGFLLTETGQAAIEHIKNLIRFGR